MDLSWLCLVAVMVAMIPVIYYGTRARLRYARRIREAQARGAFADMNTPETKSHFRRLAILSLFGSLGMILSVVMFFIQRRNGIILPGTTIAEMFIFGIIATIGGCLMKREVDRRL